jgi:hypothetical protein
MNLPYHHADSLRDYALAGTLIGAPAWVQYLNDFATPLLTFVCVLTGAVLGIRRLIRDFYKPGAGDEK